MSCLWFDVTTLIHWARPAVGVVRVEAECFKHLASLGLAHVRFCHFDPRSRRYLEIASTEVSALVSRASQPPPPPASGARASSASRANERARALVARLPSSVRAPLRDLERKSNPWLRTALHHYRSASVVAESFATQLGALAKTGSGARAASAAFARGDVFISTGLDWDQQDSAALYRLKVTLGLKVILVCYDLIPVLRPHLCVPEVANVFPRYIVDLAWCADEVLCISKSTQRDFVSLLRKTGAPEPKTRILPLGCDLPAASEGAPIEELTTGKFLLFVSTIERRKNHEVLYRALLHLIEQGRTDLPRLVFVGMEGWGVSEFLNDLRHDPRVAGRFVVLNRVSDPQLSWLYSRAEFTLYPSLYEGWGLPLAESLSHGKFCLSSNTSSLPEVAGPLAEYLEPQDHRAWAERIAHYLDHPEELAARERAILEGHRPVTWAQTGRFVFEAAEALIR